jgi:hypothetical protein
VLLVFWMPPTRKLKCQYIVGLVIYFFVGPFLSVLIQLYSFWHLNHFSWGKTRRVVSEGEDNDASSSYIQPNDEEALVGIEVPPEAHLPCRNTVHMQCSAVHVPSVDVEDTKLTAHDLNKSKPEQSPV